MIQNKYTPVLMKPNDILQDDIGHEKGHKTVSFRWLELNIRVQQKVGKVRESIFTLFKNSSSRTQ